MLYHHAQMQAYTKYLRHSHLKRQHRASSRQKRGLIPNRVGIEQRFVIAEQKREIGHWEGDTMIVTNHLYCVYLFHRPLLTILIRGSVWNLFVHQTSSKDLKFIALAVVSFPLVFLISYWIQTARDSLQKIFFAQSNSLRS